MSLSASFAARGVALRSVASRGVAVKAAEPEAVADAPEEEAAVEEESVELTEAQRIARAQVKKEAKRKWRLHQKRKLRKLGKWPPSKMKKLAKI